MAADPEFDTAESPGASPASPAVPGTQLKAQEPVQVMSAPPLSAAETPPPMKGPQSKDFERSAPKITVEQVTADTDRRQYFGVAAGILGSGVILAVLAWTGFHIGDPVDAIKNNQAVAAAIEHVVWFSIAAHTIIAVAAIFFGYQMLRLAERMFVPRHLLADETTLQVVQALVGVSSPAKAAVDTARQVAEDFAAIAKPVVELSKPLVEVAKAVSGTDKK